MYNVIAFLENSLLSGRQLNDHCLLSIIDQESAMKLTPFALYDTRTYSYLIYTCKLVPASLECTVRIAQR